MFGGVPAMAGLGIHSVAVKWEQFGCLAPVQLTIQCSEAWQVEGRLRFNASRAYRQIKSFNF